MQSGCEHNVIFSNQGWHFERVVARCPPSSSQHCPIGAEIPCLGRIPLRFHLENNAALAYAK